MNRILIQNDKKEIVGLIDLKAGNAYSIEEFSVSVEDDRYKESIRTFLRFLTPALGIGMIYQEDNTPELICRGSFADIENSLRTPHVKKILDREKLSIKMPKISQPKFYDINLPPPMTKDGYIIVM
jgi:hypothetical protein